jgi:hypothetical protein
MNKPGLAALVLLLTGCASISYEPVTLDSASPSELSELNLCPIFKAGLCYARVRADQWTSRTGIQVGPDEKYCVDALANQVWFDGNRRNVPPDGERGSWVMRLFQKRNPSAGFFSLIVNVQFKDGSVDEKAGQMVRDLKGHQYIPMRAGELVLYPNDAKAPANDSYYWYKNNSGWIWVTVKRCS